MNKKEKEWIVKAVDMLWESGCHDYSYIYGADSDELLSEAERLWGVKPKAKEYISIFEGCEHDGISSVTLSTGE